MEVSLGGIPGEETGDDAQEGSHGEADRLQCWEAGGSGSAGGGGLCRKAGISEATYRLWKRQYSGVGVSELLQLREENGRLKRLVTDLSMDRQILQEIGSKKL